MAGVIIKNQLISSLFCLNIYKSEPTSEEVKRVGDKCFGSLLYNFKETLMKLNIF